MAEPNWSNRTLFHGDNLGFLRAMNSESVDLIATDPPFNKGRDFHATPDSLAAGAKFQDRWSWERDVHEEWSDQIRDDYPLLMEAIESARYAHSDGMGAFMCFMAVRLLEMRRVLKPTGSIWLHCDPTASHYLKACMDAIFGWRNFRNEIVWCYKSGGRAKVHFPRKHDLILWYSKSHRSGQYVFNYDAVSLPRDTSTMHEPVLYDENARPYQRNVKNGKEYRYYLDRGVLPDDWWTDIQAENPASKARTGYPTQKPLPLYERMILASSNEGDVVCDPFAGCATTLVAAERLGRQWVGIDIWDNAEAVVLQRLDQEGLLGNFKLDALSFTAAPPVRTDDGLPAAPALKLQWSQAEPPSPRMSRTQMYEALLASQGAKCQGCDRVFDDPRYLELDHNIPRSDGGLNHISNRILLCGPCNRVKSNIYTLSGLRRQNQKQGYMR